MWTDKTQVRKGYQSHLENPEMGLGNVIWRLGRSRALKLTNGYWNQGLSLPPGRYVRLCRKFNSLKD